MKFIGEWDGILSIPEDPLLLPSPISLSDLVMIVIAYEYCIYSNSSRTWSSAKEVVAALE